MYPRFRALGELRFDAARQAFAAAREQLDTNHRRVLLDAYLSLAGDGSKAVIIALRELIAAIDADR